MILIKLIISSGVLCLNNVILSGVKGSSCVSSCKGIANGDYQSCLDCDVYVMCSNGILYDNRPCPAGLVWDDNLKRCEYTSSTCLRVTTSTTPPPPNKCSGCCVDGELNIRLTSNTGTVSGYLPGVRVERNVSGPVGKDECSRSVLIAADFEKITAKSSSDYFGCVTGGLCGKRMLKVEMQLSSGTRRGRLFNVGDSITNNGWGGDASTQQNDAEVDLLHPNALIYQSDKCLPYSGPRFRADNVTAAHVNKVTLYIGNQFFRLVVDDGQGKDYSFCDKCLFALNGQSDSSWGGINERVYFGINTVVQRFSSRLGVGVCGARFTWACGAN